MRRIPLFALLLALGLSNVQAQEQVPPNDADGGHAVASSDDPDAAESETTKVPLAEIRRYVGVYDAIKQAYVDPVDDHKLMQSAIKGLLLDLDPHSAYLEKSDAQAFDEETNGAYDGIGVEVVTLPDGSVKIVSAIDDTPFPPTAAGAVCPPITTGATIIVKRSTRRASTNEPAVSVPPSTSTVCNSRL